MILIKAVRNDEVEQYAGQTECEGVLPCNSEGGDFIDADTNTAEDVHGVAGQGVGDVQEGIEGQIGRGGADQGSGVGLHVDDGMPGESPHDRKRKLDDDKTSEPKRINLDQDDFEKKLDSFGEKLLNKVEDRINTINQSRKQIQDKPVVQGENQEENLVDNLMASTDLAELEKSLEELEFGKADESDEEIVFFCKICFKKK